MGSRSSTPQRYGILHPSRFPRVRRFLQRCAVGSFVAATALSLLSTPSLAQPVDSLGDEAQELAERYSPVIMVAEQDGPCDEDGESFVPMSVDLVLNNDDVTLRQAGNADPVVTRSPSAGDLFGRGDGFFLDFNGISLQPGCVYEQDFNRYNPDTESVVYAHVVSQDDSPGQLAVQYWLYWYYNDWNNNHESDWEFVQLLFEADTIAEALNKEPVSVGYAQHEGGERSSWTDPTLQRVGSHPIVFSSRGSHASYFESAFFLGRSGTEGFGCDTTIHNTVEVRPIVEVLPDGPVSAHDDFAWLGFTGRWGERGSGPFNGPTGPNTKPQWTSPIDWHEGLRQASVKVPGGEEANDTVLTTFCSVVEFGSNQLRAAQVSPTRLIVFGIAAALVLRFLVRQTGWGAVPAVPLRRRRRVGQMLRSAVTSPVTSRGAMLAISALYLPLAALVAIVGAISSFSAAQTVAAIFTSAMYVIVVASVTAYWHLEGGGADSSLLEGFRLVRSRLRHITATSILVAIIVLGLAITVIGLPFAVRQLVRYQFAISVTTVEDLTARAALTRSSELVRGRWWRTALTAGIIGGLAFVVNSALQLGLLILLSGLPLWGYVAATFLVTGLVIPLIATAPVLLYGDAAATHKELGSGERREKRNPPERPDDGRLAFNRSGA